jgi:hypothetical protein
VVQKRAKNAVTLEDESKSNSNYFFYFLLNIYY